MKGRILLTGAGGFIGRATIAPLLRRGFEVHAIARRRINMSTAVQWHHIDLFDGAADLQVLLTTVRPEFLLHFAWYAESGQFWRASENIECMSASLRLLRAFHAAGGKRVVMAGTCAEYDEAQTGPLHESSVRRPSTLYGVCKNALHDVLVAYSAQHALSSAWGRIFFPYGPHEQPVRLIPNVVCSLLKGQVARCSSGEQVRDFVHVDDVAEAFAALLVSNVIGAVNIGSGHGVAVKDVAMTIARRLGRLDLLQLGALPDRKDEPLSLVADIRRLVNEVGVTPRSLEQGLEATIDWWRQHMASAGIPAQG